MKFLWRDTLRRVAGGETRCPACHADGLIVQEREERDVLPDVRGVPWCECPSCRVRGDFPVLVSAAEGRGVGEIVRELLRIGELEASARDADAYITRAQLQVEVDGFLLSCAERLRKAPHMCNIRAGMSVSSLRQLPPDTGLFSSGDGQPPRPFALLSAPRYYHVPMTLYRYRFDGETTCVDAQNPKTLQREHRIRIARGAADVGVYLGDFRSGEVPHALLATHDPRAAGQLYGAARAESSLAPPVAAIAGFPLPNRFASVQVLYLLDAADSPLPLSFALQAMRDPVVYGSVKAPTIQVLSPHISVSEITAEDIRRLSGSTLRGKPLRKWVAERILSLTERLEEVANALLQANASENIRAEVAEMLGASAPKSLRETVLLPTAEPDDVFSLANGRLVKNTPVGIYAAARVAKTGEVVSRNLLCNVGITVESRVADRGLETAVCTVTHPDTDVPSTQVRIPRAHWGNPDALAEDVRGAYAEGGRTPYVAFYRSTGYAWSDIMQYLGSRCPVQTGLRALGATPDGQLNLPDATISRGSIAPQTKAGLVDPAALAAYSALGREADPDDGSSLSSFLMSPAALERVGVAAGLLHALFCAAGRMFDASGARRPPAHLLFVETEPGVWDSTFRTLAYLFSGSEYVPPMDYADRTGFLRSWAALGTLPLVTRLPAADDMATVLAASPVSVIAVADPLTALACSGRGTVSFVLPNVEAAGWKTPVTPDDVEELRRAFVAIAVTKSGTGWLDVSGGGPAALSTPCLSALGSLSEERGAGTVAGGLYRSVRGRYLGAGLTGARAFFSVLHRAYAANVHDEDPGGAGVKLTIVPGTPADALRASFNDRGEHVFVLPDMALVSRSVVQLVNRQQAYLFDAEQLSREFVENGILLGEAPASLGIDPRRVWAFPRETWDREVVRATGFSQNQKDAR
jgi:hypothetical protein